MKTYTTEIHLRERTDSTPDNRLFDGWLVGAQNLYPTLTIMCAMDSTRAIRWACEVERIAARLSGRFVDYHGKPTDTRVETVRVYENFTQDDKPEIQGVTWIN